MHFPLGPDLFPMTAATGRPSSEMWRPDGHHRSRSSSQQQPVVSVLTTSLPAVSQCRQLNHRSTVGVQVYLWAITAEVTIIIKCSKTARWLAAVCAAAAADCQPKHQSVDPTRDQSKREQRTVHRSLMGQPHRQSRCGGRKKDTNFAAIVHRLFFRD